MKPYYVDLGFKDVRIGMYDGFDFDSDGIPRYRYPDGVFYNITFICHFALYRHSRYLKFGRPDDLALFLHVSNWILAHGQETNGAFLFPYAFSYTYSYHRLSPPWISALGQGRILSVFARAYGLTADERYLSAALRAMRPFELAVRDGGVQARFPDGGIGFEEYPGREPNLVLNGFITALVGLYDLGETGQAPRAAELFAQAVRSLENNLHLYDLDYWSAYDLTGLVANASYHQYHIMQLWALYEMTGRETFKRYTSKWQAYRKGPRFRVCYLTTRGYTWAMRHLH
ncbi:MAG TPA: D-glucuronyl C5-epimerase family protein [Duganella sp.]|nr:D-glucuronyl C5-epimerase family protein [Duganella sp.]